MIKNGKTMFTFEDNVLTCSRISWDSKLITTEVRMVRGDAAELWKWMEVYSSLSDDEFKTDAKLNEEVKLLKAMLLKAMLQ